MAERLAEAMNYLKSRKWVDLTHTFGLDSPHFSAFPDAQFETLFTLKEISHSF